MDLIGEERGRLARAASWLDATPAEIVGLAVLLVCALAATGVLVWSALGRPDLATTDERAGRSAGAAPADETGSAGGVGDVGAPAAPGATVDDQDHQHGDAEVAADAVPSEVTVHVAGAVAEPGVVTLPAGSRVADAVAAVGGMLDDADPSRINLARPLEDGEQLLVLRPGEEPPPGTTPGAAASGAPDGSGEGDGPVDLNTASPEQLQTLPGIGPALAARIIQYREERGPFQEPGDLRDISGIGEKRFQDLAELVTVG